MSGPEIVCHTGSCELRGLLGLSANRALHSVRKYA